MGLPNVILNGPSAWEQVEEMLCRNHPFDSIEAFIESAELHADAKAALWLLAWSEQSQTRRRTIVREALTATIRPQG